MTKASDYAAVVATREAQAGAPAPFVTPNIRAEVTVRGTLLFTPTSGNPEMSSDSAVALRDWLTANFA